MPIVKTESQHKGEFLMSEAKGTLSREVVTLTSGQKVADGTLLKIVGGKAVAMTGAVNSAGNSDEVIAGFAWGAYDASATGANKDISCVVIAREAEVKESAVKLHPVTGGGAAAATAAVKRSLLSKFIVCR